MPMELYSSEALVRDIVNAISSSEGKPVNIGGNYHKDIDRAYLFQLVSEAKQAIEGQSPPHTNPFAPPKAVPKRATKRAAAGRAAPKKRVARKAKGT